MLKVLIYTTDSCCTSVQTSRSNAQSMVRLYHRGYARSNQVSASRSCERCSCVLIYCCPALVTAVDFLADLVAGGGVGAAAAGTAAGVEGAASFLLQDGRG